MPINYVKGNILDSSCEVLVNPVNCVGVMGKGLALQFRNRFDDVYFMEYQKACKARTLRPGRIQFSRDYGTSVYGVINFPTKDHWRDKSRIEWIEDGLINMASFICNRHIVSVAIPRLGCGLGGLDWTQVKPLIEKYLGNLTVTSLDPVTKLDGSLGISDDPIPVRVDVYE